MLFISSRKNLTNEDEIGEDEFWDLRIRRGMLQSAPGPQGLSPGSHVPSGLQVSAPLHRSPSSQSASVEQAA